MRSGKHCRSTMSRLMVWFRLTALVWLGVGTSIGKPAVYNVEGSPASKSNDTSWQGLYNNKDDVIILNQKNANKLIYNNSTVWVIEFYNSWCGHCIHFAPTWRQFASDLKDWRQVVAVGALDCADKENVEMCRIFNIEAYPAIKILSPSFGRNDTKAKMIQVNTQVQLEIKEVVLEYVTSLSPAPPSWPNFKPLQTLEDIWLDVKAVHKFVVVVFEDERSIVGREVILDLSDYPSVLVRTMLKDKSENLGVLRFPSLYIVTDKSSLTHVASGSGMPESDRRRFVDTLLAKMGFLDSKGKRIKASPGLDLTGAGAKGNEVVQFHQPKNQDKTQTARPKSSPATVSVHMQDLESALHYALRQEVAICNTIDGAKLDALRNFISALAKFFPGRAAVTQFLWKVVDFLSKLEEPLTGGSWVNAIDSLQDKKAFLPYQVRWVGCKGSLPLYRGYPCSMWMLFHTLTVAAYQQTGVVNALEVPAAIRGYMEHFFGCQECSRNFLKMAATLEKEVSKPLDAVLWLWASHNKANKRLHGDASEDPQHLKTQFPSREACPPCHKESGVESDPAWDAAAVSAFLVRLYGRDGIVRDVVAPVTSEPPGSRPKHREELDWWEKKQRESDLRKIRELRDKKRKDRPPTLALAEALKDRRAPVAGGLHEGGKVARKVDYMVAGIRPVTRSGWGFGFSHLDLGVCMAFYVTCTAIIVLLYYHFIVHRRFKLPCSKYLPV